MVVTSLLSGAVPSDPFHILCKSVGESQLCFHNTEDFLVDPSLWFLYRVVDERAVFGATLPGFKSQLCCLLV